MIHFGALPGSRVENEIMGEKKRWRREKIKKTAYLLVGGGGLLFLFVSFSKGFD